MDWATSAYKCLKKYYSTKSYIMPSTVLFLIYLFVIPDPFLKCHGTIIKFEQHKFFLMRGGHIQNCYYSLIF